MPVRRVISHENITSNKGKVALQRGPVVYCLEGPDNDGKVLDLVIRDDAELNTRVPGRSAGRRRHDQRPGARRPSGPWTAASCRMRRRSFTAIPYYAWAHRGAGPDDRLARSRTARPLVPKPADTLTYLSKTTASFVHVSLDAIKDQNVPTDSADSSNLQLDFWPHSGTTEWVQFEWDEPHELSSVKVYWFDDTGRGACHLPQVVANSVPRRRRPVPAGQEPRAYRTEKDTFNKVEFDPVDTTAIKIEIDLQEKWSAGIQEVVIE